MNNSTFTAKLVVDAEIAKAQSSLETLSKSINSMWKSGGVPKSYLSSLEEMKTRLAAMKELSNKGYVNAEELKNAQKEYRDFNKEIQDIILSLTLMSETQKKGLIDKKTTQAIDSATAAYKKYIASAEKQKQVNAEIADVEERLKKAKASRAKEEKKLSKELSDNGKKVQQYLDLQKEIEKTEQTISDQLAKGKNPESKQDNDLKRAQAYKAQLEESMKGLNLTPENLTAGKAEIDKWSRSIEEAQEKAAVYKTEVAALAKKLASLKASSSTQSLDSLKQTLTQLGIEGAASAENIDEIKQAIEAFEASAQQGANEAVENLIQNFRELGGETSEIKEKMEDATSSLHEQNQAFNDKQALFSRIKAFVGLQASADLMRKAFENSRQTVQDLDKEMTEMAVVTDLGISDYWDQLPEYTARANDLGAAIQDVYRASTLYYQQGLKTNEVTALSNTTLKMARIAGLDAADATDRMTAALRGFNMELNEDSAERVADVYSKLAAITAADVNDISSAMTKTASIAASAGMEFETTAAFLSQIIETTRESAETAGTAMKTVIARFQELKKDPSEIGEVDGEIVDANKIETALRSVGVALRDANGQFRDLDDVFLELAGKWGSLDTNTQRYIATIAAGSRQQSRFIAMMQDYGRTQQLVVAANSSAGASNKQFEKTMDSLEAKLNQLKNAWDTFTMGIMDSDLLKMGVDLLTGVITSINKLTEAFGPFDGAAKILILVSALYIAGRAMDAFGQSVMESKTLFVDLTQTWKLFHDNINKDIDKTITGFDDFIKKADAFLKKMNKSNKDDDATEKATEATEENQEKQEELNEEIKETTTLVQNNAEIATQAAEKIVENLNKEVSLQKELNEELRTEKSLRSDSGDGQAILETVAATEIVEEQQEDINEELKKTGDLTDSNKNSAVSAATVTAVAAEVVEEQQEDVNKEFKDTTAAAATSGATAVVAGTASAAVAEIVEEQQEDVNKELKETATLNGGVAAAAIASSATTVAATTAEITAQKALNDQLMIEKALRATDGGDSAGDGAGDAVNEVVENVIKNEGNVNKIFDNFLGKFKNLGKSAKDLPSKFKPLLESLKGFGSTLVGYLPVIAQFAFAILLVVAAIAILIAYFKHLKAKSPEGVFERVSQEADRAAEAAARAKEEFNALQDSLTSLEDSYDNLEDLTEGTREWREAVRQVNNEVLDLIDKYPELAKFYTNDNGVLKVSEENQEAYDNYLRQLELKTAQTSAMEMLAKMRLEEAQTNVDYQALSNEAKAGSQELQDAILAAGVIAGAAGGATVGAAGGAAAGWGIGTGVGAAIGAAGYGVGSIPGGAIGGAGGTVLGTVAGGIGGGILGGVVGGVGAHAAISALQEDGKKADQAMTEKIAKAMASGEINGASKAEVSQFLQDEFGILEVAANGMADDFVNASDELRKFGQSLNDAEQKTQLYKEAQISATLQTIDLSRYTAEEQAQIQAMATTGVYDEHIESAQAAAEETFKNKEQAEAAKLQVARAMYGDTAEVKGNKVSYKEGNETITVELTDEEFKENYAAMQATGELQESLQLIPGAVDKLSESFGSAGAAYEKLAKKQEGKALTNKDVQELQGLLQKNPEKIREAWDSLDAEQQKALGGYDNYVNTLVDSINTAENAFAKASRALQGVGVEIELSSRVTSEAAVGYAKHLRMIVTASGTEEVEAFQESLDNVMSTLDDEEAAAFIQQLNGMEWNSKDDWEELPGIFKEMGIYIPEDAMEEFIDTAIETSKAIDDINLEKLTEQLQSLSSIANSMIAGEQSRTVSKEDYDLIIESGAAKEEDFIKTLDGSYMYLGESIQSLGEAIAGNSTALAENTYSMLDGRVEAASILENIEMPEVTEAINEQKEAIPAIVQPLIDLTQESLDSAGVDADAAKVLQATIAGAVAGAAPAIGMAAATGGVAAPAVAMGATIGSLAGAATGYVISTTSVGNDNKEANQVEPIDEETALRMYLSDFMKNANERNIDISGLGIEGFSNETDLNAITDINVLKGFVEGLEKLTSEKLQNEETREQVIGELVVGYQGRSVDSNIEQIQTLRGRDSGSTADAVQMEALAKTISASALSAGMLGEDIQAYLNALELLKYAEGEDRAALLADIEAFEQAVSNNSQKLTEWISPFDELYRINQNINAEIRTREKLERDYTLLLAKRGVTGAELVEIQKSQLASYENSATEQLGLIDQLGAEINSMMSNNAHFAQFVKIDEESGQVQVDSAAVAEAGFTKEEGAAFETFVNDLQGLVDQNDEGVKALWDIYDGIEELEKQGEEDYTDLIGQVRETLIDQKQATIDELQQVNSSIESANSSMIDSVSKAISQERQERDNAKTEQNIADKQSRLLYLQSNSSGGNTMEIARLQKEIQADQEAYQDSLIDQTLNSLKDANEEASKQRNKQIEIAEAQLAIWEKTSAGKEAESVLKKALSSGTPFSETDIGKLILQKETEGKSDTESNQITQTLDQQGASAGSYQEMVESGNTTKVKQSIVSGVSNNTLQVSSPGGFFTADTSGIDTTPIPETSVELPIEQIQQQTVTLSQFMEAVFTETLPRIANNIGKFFDEAINPKRLEEIKQWIINIPNSIGKGIDSLSASFKTMSDNLLASLTMDNLKAGLASLHGTVVNTLRSIGKEIQNSVIAFLKEWEWVDGYLDELVKNIEVFFTQTLPNWFWDNLVPFFKPSTYISFVNDIVAAIIPIFTEKLPTAIYGAIGEISKWVVRVFYTIPIEFAAEAAKQVDIFMYDTIPSLIEKIKEWIKPYFTADFWQEVFIGVGVALLHVFTTTIPRILDGVAAQVSRFIAEIVDDIQTTLSSTGNVFDTLFTSSGNGLETMSQQVVDYYGFLGDEIENMGASVGDYITNHIELVKSNIAKTLQTIVTTFQNIVASVQNIWNTLITTIQDTFAMLTSAEFWSYTMEALGAAISYFIFVTLPELITQGITFIQNAWTSLCTNIINMNAAVESFGHTMERAVINLGHQAETAVANALVAFADFGHSIEKAIGDAFSSIWEFIIEIGVSAIEFLANLGTAFIDFVKNLPSYITSALQQAGTFFTDLKTDAEQAVTDIIGFFEGIGQKIADFFKPLTDKIAEIKDDLLGAAGCLIQGDFDGAWKKFDELFADIGELITTFGQKVQDLAAGIAYTIGSPIVDGLNTVIGKLNTALEGMVDGMTGAINSFVKGLTTYAPDWLKEKLGLSGNLSANVPDIPLIPKMTAPKGWTGFKTGGLADFTGPAWLDGTKSRPEIVLNQQDSANFIMLKDILADVLHARPAETRSGSGDNYIDIQINVEEIKDDYDVEQMANKIRSMLYNDATYRNPNMISSIR